MPIIERPDYTVRRRHAPATIKLVLLIAVILGFYFRSCWYSRVDQYYEITDIEFENQTMSSVDVLFAVTNRTNIEKQEPVIIRVYTDTGDELASRITRIDIPPLTRRRYRTMVENWSRALALNESLSHATVEIYKPSIF